jgi:hypothetical protein
MTVPDLAHRHRLRRRELALILETEGVRAWGRLDPRRLDDWSPSALMVALAGAQLAAARQADQYVAAALEEQGITIAAEGAVVARGFAGRASDGRRLDTLLQRPVVAAKLAIAKGATIPRAMATGQATLGMILRTQVADAGRVADGVAIAARPKTGYVRMLVGKTCPRCTILAGKFYRYSQGFQRHPRCDCFHLPAQGSAARDLVTDPKDVFNSLARDEQDRSYGKAGAQAIRDGADMNQVVNARRGMTAAGTTAEGTTRRGLANRPLSGRERLMPERIYQVASDRDEVLSLLRRHGYLF